MSEKPSYMPGDGEIGLLLMEFDESRPSPTAGVVFTGKFKRLIERTALKAQIEALEGHAPCLCSMMADAEEDCISCHKIKELNTRLTELESKS